MASLLVYTIGLFFCATFTLANSSIIAPAFFWSEYRSFELQTQGVVDYRIFSPLALLQKFDHLTSVCTEGNKGEFKVDAVLAFFGNELRSEDISHDLNENHMSLRKILSESFSNSKYSVALPYVSIPTRGPRILDELVLAIKNRCELKTKTERIMMMRTCLKHVFEPSSLNIIKDFQIAENIDDITDFIQSRQNSRRSGEADIIIACPGSEAEYLETDSEGTMLSSILSTFHRTGTSNVVMYASDPSVSQIPHEYDSRVLASYTSSSNSTCDEICETVAGIYEGVIVAITLLIILISGLCCMMGIETPTRFEASQES